MVSADTHACVRAHTHRIRASIRHAPGAKHDDHREDTRDNDLPRPIMMQCINQMRELTSTRV